MSKRGIYAKIPMIENRGKKRHLRIARSAQETLAAEFETLVVEAINVAAKMVPIASGMARSTLIPFAEAVGGSIGVDTDHGRVKKPYEHFNGRYYPYRDSELGIRFGSEPDAYGIEIRKRVMEYSAWFTPKTTYFYDLDWGAPGAFADHMAKRFPEFAKRFLRRTMQAIITGEPSRHAQDLGE